MNRLTVALIALLLASSCRTSTAPTEVPLELGAGAPAGGQIKLLLVRADETTLHVDAQLQTPLPTDRFDVAVTFDLDPEAMNGPEYDLSRPFPGSTVFEYPTVWRLPHGTGGMNVGIAEIPLTGGRLRISIPLSVLGGDDGAMAVELVTLHRGSQVIDSATAETGERLHPLAGRMDP